MEVINFKTAYSVHDKVYILVGGEIRLGKIAAIAFCGDGYAYDVETSAAYSKTATTTSRRKESEIRITLEDAINYAVETYRKSLCDDWGLMFKMTAKLFHVKQKINNKFCIIQKLLLSLQ
jgi:hypothetical protein